MDSFEEGMRLFNEGSYLEAQEEWEPLWIILPSSQRKGFLQGLIMLAIAFHKYETNEYLGMEKLLKNGIALLKKNREGAFRMDIEDLLEQADNFLNKYISDSRGIENSDFPKISPEHAVR
jgi:predicted metal-dependent hydrolase